MGKLIGYSPVISVPNVGVTAQVRPTFIPGTKTAMLDIASIITRWDPSRKSAIVALACDKQVIAVIPAPAPPGPESAQVAGTTAPSHLRENAFRSRRLGFLSRRSAGNADPADRHHATGSLGKPVIVGAVTFAPAGDAGLGAAKVSPVDVYLIATTSIVRDAK